MVRISDIIGKSQQPKEPDKEKKSIQQPSISQISSGLIHNLKSADKSETEALYQDLLSLIGDIVKKVEQKRQAQIEIDKVKKFITKLIDQISLGNDYLFSISYFSSVDDYLPVHLLNTCIYSLGLGISLGLDKSKLEELGTACIFYDIGLLKVQDLVKKSSKLNPSEYEKLKLHTQDAADLLRDIDSLPQVVSIVITQHHERFDGSGYPQGLKQGQIHEFSRIVGLCDTYEALTHNRPYEKKVFPYKAMREILQQKNLFDPRILKSFIDTMGIYPVETWVELSDGEVGEVTSMNKISVLRPTVTIYIDSQGQRIAEPKLIDLSKETNLYIKKALESRDIP